MFRNINNQSEKTSRISLVAPVAAVLIAVVTLLAGTARAVEEQSTVVVVPDEGVWVSRSNFDDRAYLGVRLEEETELEEGGARVTSVVDDSPADEAGLRKGDVIVEFDGRTIRGPVGLTEAIHARESGDTVSVTVVRDGRRQTLDVEMGDWSHSLGREFQVIAPEAFGELSERLEGLGERLGNLFTCDEDDDCSFAAPLDLEACEGGDCGLSWTFAYGRPVLGVQLVEVTPELREHLGADADRGVLVSKVVDRSAAEDAGIEVGDLIVSVAGDDISNTRDLRNALHDKRGETFSVEVIRDGRSVGVDVTIPEPKRERPTGPRARLVLPDVDGQTVFAPRIRIRYAAPPRPAKPSPPLLVTPTPPVAPRPPRPAKPLLELRREPSREALRSV